MKTLVRWDNINGRCTEEVSFDSKYRQILHTQAYNMGRIATIKLLKMVSGCSLAAGKYFVDEHYGEMIDKMAELRNGLDVNQIKMLSNTIKGFGGIAGVFALRVAKPNWTNQECVHWIKKHLPDVVGINFDFAFSTM